MLPDGTPGNHADMLARMRNVHVLVSSGKGLRHQPACMPHSRARPTWHAPLLFHTAQPTLLAIRPGVQIGLHDLIATHDTGATSKAV